MPGYAKKVSWEQLLENSASQTKRPQMGLCQPTSPVSEIWLSIMREFITILLWWWCWWDFHLLFLYHPSHFFDGADTKPLFFRGHQPTEQWHLPHQGTEYSLLPCPHIVIIKTIAAVVNKREPLTWEYFRVFIVVGPKAYGNDSLRQFKI